MNFEKFTIKSQEALQKSAEIATALQQQAIEPGHILKAIFETDENVSNYLVKKLGINATILETKLEEMINGYQKFPGSRHTCHQRVIPFFKTPRKNFRNLRINTLLLNI